jgi:hypothetical protein
VVLTATWGPPIHDIVRSRSGSLSRSGQRGAWPLPYGDPSVIAVRNDTGNTLAVTSPEGKSETLAPASWDFEVKVGQSLKLPKSTCLVASADHQHTITVMGSLQCLSFFRGAQMGFTAR